MAASVGKNDVALGAARTCLLCHTIDNGVTHDGLDRGQYWRCTRCGQMWDAARLAAATAYSLTVVAGQARVAA
jgi:hypothetical protein